MELKPGSDEPAGDVGAEAAATDVAPWLAMGESVEDEKPTPSTTISAAAKVGMRGLLIITDRLL